MKKICIAPFTSEEFSVVASLEKNYSVVSVVSPNGIGIGNNDIGILQNRVGLGIYGGGNIKDEFSKCDTVVISKCSENLRTFAIEALEMAINCRKDIICFLELSTKEKAKYLKRCKELNINLTILDFFDILQVDIKDYKYKKMNLPVIYIGEIAENLDGDEIFFKTLNYYRSNNYKVLGLSENIYAHLFEQVPLTFFCEKDFEQAIMRLNCYINDLIHKHKPDIIVIKLPKPVIQFSNYIHYDFGISAHMTASAIPPDYLLLCTPLGLISPNLYEMLHDSFLSKFGVDITGVHVGNQIVDNSYENVEGKFEFVYDKFDKSLTYAKELRENGYNAYNFTNNECLYTLLDNISTEALKLSYGVI